MNNEAMNNETMNNEAMYKPEMGQLATRHFLKGVR